MIRQRYISRRFDEAAILASLANIAFQEHQSLEEQDYAVMAALKRSSDTWDLPISDMSDRLAAYDEAQIGGLVSNVKGILHEMEFVRLENDDGDSVVAAMFPDTNHKSVDIHMIDESSGETWDVQLKATEDSSAINSWLESNPDTEILVTEELAKKMNIDSSGFSNEELTVRVEDFVDRMIDLDSQADQSLWSSFPVLVAASTGIIVFELWRRYRSGLITQDQFKQMTLRTLGVKAGKYALILSALAVPGLNVLVGAYLLGSLILSVTTAVDRSPSYRPFSFLGKT